MTPYLHYSATAIPVLKDRLEQPIKAHKPNGLWLSEGTAWKEWCAEQGFSTCDMRTCKTYGACINEVNLYVIDTFEKLWEFSNEYYVPPAYTGWIDWHGINWARVAQKYDGIVIRNYKPLWNQCFYAWQDGGWYYNPTQVREKTTWFRTLDIDCACIWRTKAVTTWISV